MLLLMVMVDSMYIVGYSRVLVRGTISVSRTKQRSRGPEGRGRTLITVIHNTLRIPLRGFAELQ